VRAANRPCFINNNSNNIFFVDGRVKCGFLFPCCSHAGLFSTLGYLLLVLCGLIKVVGQFCYVVACVWTLQKVPQDRIFCVLAVFR